MANRLYKSFLDSCIFLEIILQQTKWQEVTKLLEGYKPCSLFYINPQIIREVFFRIEETITENFKNNNRYFNETASQVREINTMRKEFYIHFENLLQFCKLITVDDECEDISRIRQGVEKLKFNTQECDMDKTHLITAISRRMDFFITLDKSIIQEGGKINGISNGKLNVVSI